jgi:type I restriction enzyme M protein
LAKRHGVGKSARSAVARIEEIVLASSGADAFELVLALSAARLFAGEGAAKGAPAIRRAVARARRAWRWLELPAELDVPDATLVAVWELLGGALAKTAKGSSSSMGEVLDAVFEELVTRVGKGEKGQFFTPRHVVDLAVGAVGLARGERVIDPACGSGAFLTHARARAEVRTWGCDVDARAVRVAKLLAVASGESPDARVRGDALADRGPESGWPKHVDVVLTNPPFAGDVKRAGFELGRLVHRAERDAFFLERCVNLLRPGGRLAIVLPHGKVGAPAWAPLRRWLVERARVFAVVSLPRETFLPHTSQRTVLVVAKKRAPRETPQAREKILFVASERAGKDAAGEPIFRAGADPSRGHRALDHDLEAVAVRLSAFLSAESFAP